MKDFEKPMKMINADGKFVSLQPPQQPRKQSRIMQNWGGVYEPVVSIFCATYNHENYISDAINSFLMQETEFPFEIIIRDDASTDSTSKIIQDYAQRYPDIIRLLVNSENRFSMGERAIHVLPSLVRGKYCALCEGDDFWISPVKLQKQFELLEKYPQAVMSVAKSHDCQQKDDGLHYLSTTNNQNQILLTDIGMTNFHTSTYLIRTDIFKKVIKKYFSGHTLFGDTALRAILIMHGPFAFLSEVVSVYRITRTGIWARLNREKQLKWEFDVARRLAGTLPGLYRKHQQWKAYDLGMKLLRLRFANGQIIKGIEIAPLVFWYKLIKVPGYVQRKLKSIL